MDTMEGKTGRGSCRSASWLEGGRGACSCGARWQPLGVYAGSRRGSRLRWSRRCDGVVFLQPGDSGKQMEHTARVPNMGGVAPPRRGRA